MIPKVQMIRVSLFVEAARNPNVMSAERFSALTTAIRKEGFLQPVLARSVGTCFEVVDGHHRLRAAREIGLDEIPTVIVDGRNDAQIEALRLAMNRLRGDLDLAITGQIMSDLATAGWSLEELTLTGFPADEISDLLSAMKAPTTEDILSDVSLDGPEEKEGIFVIEIPFMNRDEYMTAKAGLKRAAKGADLARGLLRLLGEC